MGSLYEGLYGRPNNIVIRRQANSDVGVPSRNPNFPGLGDHSRLSRSRQRVQQLAHRFLEDNVRNCIKPRIFPRIFPMESTSIPSPIPIGISHQNHGGNPRFHKPLVSFTSDIRLRRRSVQKPYDGFDFIDEILERSALINEAGKSGAENISKGHQVTNSSSSARINRGESYPTTYSTAVMMNSPRKSQNNGHISSCTFATALKKWNVPIPPVLSRKLARTPESPMGKVKVMLRVCENTAEENLSGNVGILGVDQRRKQVTLLDPVGNNVNIGTNPTPEERRLPPAPKMFAFDSIFTEDDDQTEICSASVAELVASVLGGEDGCLLALGYCNAGKKQTMIGRAANQKLGAIPTAISWLFKSIQDQKQKTGCRFSIRVSAIEIQREIITDLLASFVNDGDQQSQPGQLLDSQLPNGPNGSSSSSTNGRYSKHGNSNPILNTVSEVRAPTAESAGFFLDSALEAMNNDDPSKHFVFTLHIYQYTQDRNGKGVVGGRSRLHCINLGNGSPSISVLGGLLLAVLNGQRHLPSRDSKLGTILRECLGSILCRAVVMIHVSNSHSRYSETLGALQLGARVHRLRRSRRLKMGSVGSGGNGSGGSSGGSGEEMRNIGPLTMVSSGCQSQSIMNGGGILSEGVETPGSSDIDPSSSEQSCDTVIYLGPSIDEATDGEHPPVYLPSLDSPKCPTSTTSSTLSPSSSGIPPKTKSPKPKSSIGVRKTLSSEGSSKLQEEQWIDGPGQSKCSRTSNNNSSNSGSGSGTSVTPAGHSNNSNINNHLTGKKKNSGETWIDGPCSNTSLISRVHQANNFPSPKKIPNGMSQKIRGGGGQNSTPSALVGPSSDISISKIKEQMIQKWISNQAHALLEESTSIYPESSGQRSAGPPPTPKRHFSTHLSSQLQSQKMKSDVSNCMPSPLLVQRKQYTSSNGFHHQNGFHNGFTSSNSNSNYENENNYYNLQEHHRNHNGFEFELIEVEEPEIPVQTKDACFQVSEEDIALSFLEENLLPESDQNMCINDFSISNMMFGLKSKLGESRTHHHQNNDQFVKSLRERSSSFSEDFLQHENHKNDENHPLRVLSHDCLTVVSNIADSLQIDEDDDDLKRYWQRKNGSNQMEVCHGLCRNLLSLSQISLTNSTNHQNVESTLREIELELESLESKCAKQVSENQNKIEANNSIINGLKSPTRPSSSLNNNHNHNFVTKIPNGIKVQELPVLSDESIYKTPTPQQITFNLNTKNLNSKPAARQHNNYNSGASDAEELTIPPMKLLDTCMTMIKNNPLTEEPPQKPLQLQPTITANNPINSITKMSLSPKRNPYQNGNDQNINQQNNHSATTDSLMIKTNGHCNGNGNGILKSSIPIPVDNSKKLSSQNGQVDQISCISPDQSEIMLSPSLSSPPMSPAPPNNDITKSPSKSKSRRIARFFRTRSKSPKTMGATSSSESGKSSSDAKSSASSSSSGSAGTGTGNSSKSKFSLQIQKSSPKHSPKKTAKNNNLQSSVANDYHFTCDSVLPMFLPSPNHQKNLTSSTTTVTIETKPRK